MHVKCSDKKVEVEIKVEIITVKNTVTYSDIWQIFSAVTVANSALLLAIPAPVNLALVGEVTFDSSS